MLTLTVPDRLEFEDTTIQSRKSYIQRDESEQKWEISIRDTRSQGVPWHLKVTVAPFKLEDEDGHELRNALAFINGDQFIVKPDIGTYCIAKKL